MVMCCCLSPLQGVHVWRWFNFPCIWECYVWQQMEGLGRISAGGCTEVCYSENPHCTHVGIMVRRSCELWSGFIRSRDHYHVIKFCRLSSQATRAVMHTWAACVVHIDIKLKAYWRGGGETGGRAEFSLLDLIVSFMSWKTISIEASSRQQCVALFLPKCQPISSSSLSLSSRNPVDQWFPSVW